MFHRSYRRRSYTIQFVQRGCSFSLAQLAVSGVVEARAPSHDTRWWEIFCHRTCTHVRMRSLKGLNFSFPPKIEPMLHEERWCSNAVHCIRYKTNPGIDVSMPLRQQQPLFDLRLSKFRRLTYLSLDTLVLLLVQFVLPYKTQLYGEQSVKSI